jgi:TolB-like protein/Tfp pilus assembly protein PilF
MGRPLDSAGEMVAGCMLLPPGVTPEDVRDQVARILASGIFADSQRMSRFLQFAVDEVLNGNAGRLKEIVIGAEVFDRGSRYDPRVDPIVRVEARRLRTKLSAYYDGPGKHDPVILEFPKGQYSPIFKKLSASPPEPLVEPEPVNSATIAVLPFSNLSPQPDSSYFSDGMTEELIHALTRISGLRVVAWNTAAQLRDKQDDVGSIRRQLGVAHVLRGSVRNSGERLRIAAQLIDTATGQYVWSQTWDRQIQDVFAIQAEIAASIATTLKLKFWKPADKRPPDPETYRLCLQGRFHARERTAEGFRRSLVCFERALSIDSDCAPAYAGLADTYTLIAEYSLASPAEYMPRARAAAQRALELDPLSGEAHAAQALILTFDWRWEEAEYRFRRSLELNHGNANAHHWYGIDFLAMHGRLEEAIIEIETARELDPLSSIILEGWAFLKTLARRYDEAIERYNELIRLDPSFYKGYTSLGRAYLQKRMYAAAIAKAETGRSLAGTVPSILGLLGEAHARSGNHAEARRLLAELREMIPSQPVHSSSFAIIHLGLGEKDEALTWLERAVDNHEPQACSFKMHPVYDEVRGEPRFQALLSRIGLR